MRKTLLIARTLAVIGLAAAAGSRTTAPLDAQSGISITSPANGQIFPAGPDFATNAFSDPWDFSNRQDVALDPAQIDGFTNFNVASGFAGGTLTNASANGSAQGSNFFTLQRPYEGIINPGRNGQRFPIDPTIYSKLAFKMTTSGAGASNEFPRVFWFHNTLGSPAGDGAGWRFTDPNVPAPTGNNIFVVNLAQGNQNGLNQGVAWSSGLVTGFAFYPKSSADTSFYDVQFDWVRITTPDGHPASSTIPITWSGTSTNVTIRVVDAAGTSFNVATGVNGNSFNFNCGILPPGTYTLFVGTASRTFVINAPPTIVVTDPDETGGEDFATVVLNNGWDFNDTADFRFDGGATIVDHLLSRGVSGGQFHGTSDGQTVGQAGPVNVGDPQLYLLSNGNANNTTDIINTGRYHRLTFGLQTDRAFSLQFGSVARVFWGNATGPGAPYNVTTTKDIITWPGLNQYTVDLATLSTAPNGGLEIPNATAWTAAPVRHFRIDPHEFAEVLNFHFDNVKLAADDETTNGSFTIRWTGSDSDNPTGDTVALYYDTDRNPASGLTLITGSVALSAGQFVWNTNNVPSGTYYIYAVANDGRNSAASYSSGPVKVVSFTPTSQPFIDLDTPRPGQVVTSAFEVGGWALDFGATSGTGVDSVVFYIFPNAGAGAPVFIGQGSYGLPRPDVGAIFGSRFNNSGFHFTITGMGPGDFVLGVYAHSTVTNNYTIVKTVPFTVNANALMSVDVPSAEATISAPSFGISGWALDRQIEGVSPTGTGVDTLHIYAYPNPGSGQPPIFLGVASVGISRPDVAALYGSRYTNCGYVLNVSRAAVGMGPGVYGIVVHAHSSATGTFNNFAVVRVVVQ